uniref:Small ribosomal subunit protein uS7c n=1 Tax=Microglena monadina TaxID=47904 RepID=A0A0S2IBY2_9CHLO|nr:ribosomal protein S7 [Microglena monadina]
MPRSYRVKKRTLLPDPVYNNVLVHAIINRILKSGKKTLAYKIVYDGFKNIEYTTGKNPIEIFETAIDNLTPKVMLKPRRRSGAMQLVPRLVRPTDHPKVLVLKWIIDAAHKRLGEKMVNKLKNEIIDAYKKQGAALKKKDEYHKIAITNAMYARKPQNIINAINKI